MLYGYGVDFGGLFLGKNLVTKLLIDKDDYNIL